jgi:hypothetical protein
MKKFIQQSKTYQGIAVLIFALCIQTSQAQIKLKQYILPGTAMFLSGMLDGTIESINYHYENGFKREVQGADDQFWNPELSWKNKYKNGDPTQGSKFYGSTSALVFTTDAYHALRASKNILNTFTIVYSINGTCAEKTSFKKKWKKIAMDAVVLTAMRTIGFYTTYNIIFKQH